MKHVRYMDSKDDLYYFGGDGIMVKSVFYTWSGKTKAIPIILLQVEEHADPG